MKKKKISRSDYDRVVGMYTANIKNADAAGMDREARRLRRERDKFKREYEVEDE